MSIELQEWVKKLPEDDRKRLAHALRFGSDPKEIIELMEEFRAKYDFIPPKQT